jgi:hypothetical protein
LTRFSRGEVAIPIDGAYEVPAYVRFYNSYCYMSVAQARAHWSKFLFTRRGEPP